MIKFTKDNYKESLRYKTKPVLNIIRISCQFREGIWINRLISAAITIKILCLDSDDIETASSQTSLAFGAFISANHKQPVLEINRYFKFSNELFPEKYKSCKNWNIEIELNNIILNLDESIVLELMDSEYIRLRINDWKNRIENLYSLIEEWISGKPGYKIKIINDLIMYEELMKNFELPSEILKSADLLFNDNLLLTLKPFGLWIIGANGRIDIISRSGNFILVDYSDKFQKPDWKIYLKNKKENYSFSRDLFLKLIEG